MHRYSAHTIADVRTPAWSLLMESSHRLFREREKSSRCPDGEIECLLNDNHQKGKMMIMIMKTSGSQVDSPVVEGKRTEGGGRKMRDLHRDT